MEHWTRRGFLAGAGGAALGGPLGGSAALAQSDGSNKKITTAEEIDDLVADSLEIMQDEYPYTTEVLQQAKGVLIMPRIVRAGFIVGGSYGEGALLIGGEHDGYYEVIAGSFGLQIGGARYASALFFMSDEKLEKFRNGVGFTLGADMKYVGLDDGGAASVSTASSSADVFSLIYNQRGVAFGLSLDGGKYTRVERY